MTINFLKIKAIFFNSYKEGIGISIAKPTKPKGIEKWDFNDALLNQGVEQVRKDLDNAFIYSKPGSINKEIIEKTGSSISNTIVDEKAIQINRQTLNKTLELGE